MQRARQLLIEAKSGLAAWEDVPEGKLAGIARILGPDDVADIVGELDVLSVEAAGVPEHDGDTRDDIAKVQTLYSRILGMVPRERAADVAEGLKCRHPNSRVWA